MTTTITEGLYGPTPDGTYYGELRFVPDGWEHRSYAADDDWVNTQDSDSNMVVEARPKPEPPLVVEIDRKTAEWFAESYGRGLHPNTQQEKVAHAFRKALEAEQ